MKMLRIFITVSLGVLSTTAFAGIDECTKAKDKDVGDAQGELVQYQVDDANRSAAASPSGSSPMVKGGGALQSGTSANAAQLKKALANNADRKKHCQKMCDPNQTNTPPSQPVPRAEEQGKIIQAGKECKSGIEQVEQQENKDLATNEAANPKAGDTADKGGAGKPGDNTKTADASPSKGGGMPPMSMPQIPSPSSDKKPDPTTPTDPAAPPAAAAPASTPPPTQTADKGGADGFKTAAAKAAAQAAACPGRNTTEIQGCTEAPMQVASNTPTPFSQATAGGGSPGSGSGGGLNAASVASALAGGVKLGESEKDGKNSGLKASSLNLGTDGGGGGGGGGSSHSLDDLDFMRPNLRNPASLAVAKKADMAVPGYPGVAQERFSVVRIVTDVYSDRCKASLMLHCGKNK